MKTKMPRVAGVTVFYNPALEVIENILSYIDQIEILYIVDNSEEKLNEKIKAFISFYNIRVINNYKNLGIATALNQASNQAIIDGFDFLLTMDQDSKISENLVDCMLKEFAKDEQIGILSPFVVHNINPRMPTSYLKEEIKIAITSGSIIKLSVFNEVGGFLDKLFIDYVDFEYSLRIVSRGYKIFQLNNIFVYHNLGEIKVKKIFSKKIYPTNHSPVRLYYRTRNRFYIYKLYKDLLPEFVQNDKKIFHRELIKIFLFENKRFKKYFMIITGYFHYKKNKFGKFENLTSKI